MGLCLGKKTGSGSSAMLPFGVSQTTSGGARKKSRLNIKITGEFCIIFFAGRPEKKKKMQNLQIGGGYWSMFAPFLTNIQTGSSEFLIREMSSRAWPRSAAPHRSLPHDREKPPGRPRGAAAQACREKSFAGLGTTRLRTCSQGRGKPIVYHGITSFPLPCGRGFGFAVHRSKLFPAPVNSLPL